MVSRQAYTKNNKVSLVHNGEEFIEKSVKLVKEAKEKILFHMYIFEEDEITSPVIEALIEKAREGIKVYLLLDAFGTPELSSELKERMDSAGIHRAYFGSFFSVRSEHLGRRLHQKVLIIDNAKALTGGINLSKKFISPDQDKPWLDYSVILEGEEVYRLQRKTLRLYTKNFPQQKEELRGLVKKATFNFENDLLARTVVNDFMRFKTEIHQSYLRAIKNAKTSIKLTGPYFLPGKKLLRELKKASKRGVRIELVFGKRSDVTMERWSSRYLYDWYLKHGLKVYEWQKSILHAKAAVIDNEWVSIGSYNHNYLSRYACLEINVEVKDKGFAQEITSEFEKIKKHSELINQDGWRKNGSWYRAPAYFLTYALANLITFVSLLFVFRSKEKPE